MPCIAVTSVSRTGFGLLLVVAGWVVLLLLNADPLSLISGYWHFLPLGIAGAIAANATGAGGGIVFIPAFTGLGIGDASALGTSIAIQCFGMTAGSISWLYSIRGSGHAAKQAQVLTTRLLAIAGVPAVSGMLSGQYLLPAPGLPVSTIFKYFSILFGIVLLVVSLRKAPHRHTRYFLRRRDIVIVVLVCYAGGLITSWISVGVGEWLALALFFLGYPTMVAVCVAVCISSWTVLSGIYYHAVLAASVSWQILLFAAPGAIVGGSVARFLAHRLGPVRLKIFFAAWIIATGFAMP